MKCVVVEHKKLCFVVTVVLKVLVIECNKTSFVSRANEGCGGRAQQTKFCLHKLSIFRWKRATNKAVSAQLIKGVVIEHDKQSDFSKTHKECGVRAQKHEVLSTQVMQVWVLEY